MQIVKFPHPALLKRCKEVTVFGPELKLIMDTMYLTMIQAKGLGLAGNQVGLDINAFVMLDDNDEPLYLVNPHVIQQSPYLAYQEEACLSAPGERVDTMSRASWVNVRFQDVNGSICHKLFGGIRSVCVQHEMEHLQGKAFFQNKTITKTKRIRLCKKWGIKLK